MRRFTLPLLLIVAYLVLVAISFCVTSDWTGRQSYAVILTGAVIVWYTWETSELRKASHRQMALQVRPFVVLSRSDNQFKVTNSGNGPALNVRVSDVQVLSDAGAVIRFPEAVAILPRDATSAIKAKSFLEGRYERDFLDAHLDPQYANRSLSIELRYQDVDLRTYTVNQRTGPGTFEITGFSESAGT